MIIKCYCSTEVGVRVTSTVIIEILFFDRYEYYIYFVNVTKLNSMAINPSGDVNKNRNTNFLFSRNSHQLKYKKVH